MRYPGGIWAARAAVNRHHNTASGRKPWERFDFMNHVAHEIWRGLKGIDGPNAWCGRNARLRRYVESIRRDFDQHKPKLPD